MRKRRKHASLANRRGALVDAGRSYRLIGRELGLSKNTVADIVKRRRVPSAGGSGGRYRDDLTTF